MGLAPPTVSAVPVDGGQNTPTPDDGADAEVALDIQVAGGVAPGAAIAVYFAPNTDAGFADAISQAVHDTANKPSVISISWGSAEPNWTAQAVSAMNSAMQDAGTLRVSVFVASGDNLATDSVNDGKVHVDFPASSPYAIGCGGTQLNASGGTVGSEVVWNDGNSGTGGGISALAAVPAFQSAVTLPMNVSTNAPGRGVPDVAGNAAPGTGYEIVVGGPDPGGRRHQCRGAALGRTDRAGEPVCRSAGWVFPAHAVRGRQRRAGDHGRQQPAVRLQPRLRCGTRLERLHRPGRAGRTGFFERSSFSRHILSSVPVSPAVTRRSFLAALGASALVGAPPDWAGALSARAHALGGPGLLESYEGAGSGDDRTQAGCAYVYDNAVAGLAMLAAGDRAGAERIGDALLRAQLHDRFWHDGRLRNGYRAGPATGDAYKLPGWWDAAGRRWVEDGYQAGTATGVVAWAMLLWIGLGGAYRPAALSAADWLEAVRGPRGYQGGFLGFEPRPQRLTWVSTEHNVDLHAALTALGRADQAAHARAFVESMWAPRRGAVRDRAAAG